MKQQSREKLCEFVDKIDNRYHTACGVQSFDDCSRRFIIGSFHGGHVKYLSTDFDRIVHYALKLLQFSLIAYFSQLQH